MTIEIPAQGVATETFKPWRRVKGSDTTLAAEKQKLGSAADIKKELDVARTQRDRLLTELMSVPAFGGEGEKGLPAGRRVGDIVKKLERILNRRKEPTDTNRWSRMRSWPTSCAGRVALDGRAG